MIVKNIVSKIGELALEKHIEIFIGSKQKVDSLILENRHLEEKLNREAETWAELVADLRDENDKLREKNVNVNNRNYDLVCKRKELTQANSQYQQDVDRLQVLLGEERERLKPLPESKAELELKNAQEVEKLLRNEIEALKESVATSLRARRHYERLTGEVIQEAPNEVHS